MMNRLQSLWYMLKCFALSTVFWLALHGTVLAKKAPEAKKESGGAWTLPYILVLMGIILGMLMVCRSSGRRDRAKPEEYQNPTEKRVSQSEIVEEEARKKKEAEEQKKQQQV